MEHLVLHVDLDQFIVAVELLRRPELRGQPVLVGGVGDPARRGVVAGASYEARRYGVRSGTPLRTAAARCPDAVFLPVDRAAYVAASESAMAVLREIGGVLEVAGWDEAFLLVEAADAERTAQSVREAVRERTGLECSVGIGDNKHRAKLASGLAKPAGVFRLDTANWAAVMAHRPTDALWGIGGKTARKLAEFGVHTVRDLATADPRRISAVFGPRMGRWLVALAHGWGSTEVDPEPYRPRSVGREVTFEHDLTELDAIRAEVRRLVHRVAEDLREQDLFARRIVVKVRFAPFTTHTHGVRLAAPGREPAAIDEAAATALEAFNLNRPVRLLGVRAEVADQESTVDDHETFTRRDAT